MRPSEPAVPSRPARRSPWRRRILTVAIAVAIVGVVTAICLDRFGGWHPDSLATDLRQTVASTLPAIPIAALFALVGTAALILVPGVRLGRHALTVGVGVGIGILTLAIAIGALVFGNAVAVIVPVLVAAIVILVGKALVGLRRSRLTFGAGVLALTRNARATVDLGTPIVSIVIALAALSPLTRYGLTSWTTHTDDFASYVARAQGWMVDTAASLPFLTTHPDLFGREYLSGATWDKPTATGFLIFASEVTGLPDYELLTAIMLVLLATLIAAGAYAVRRAFGLRAPFTWIVASLPALSIVPFSRLTDAQPGQALVVALGATFVALWVSLPARGRRRDLVWPILLAAVVATSALAADFTLTVAVLPPLLAASAWLAARRGLRPAWMVATIGATAIGVVMASLALIPGFVTTFTYQANGTDGFNVPLASPLALVGLQPSLDTSAVQSFVIAGWILVVVVGAALLIASVRRSIAARYLLALFLVSVACATGLVLVYGSSSYVVHKWTAMTIAIFMPLVCAQVVVKRRALTNPVALSAYSIAGIVSLVFALTDASSVNYVLPGDLIALSSNKQLAKLDALNVDLPGIQQESMAPLIVPSRKVITVGQTYASPSPPLGDQFLIARAAAPDASWLSVIPLSPHYALATADLTLPSGTTQFDSALTAKYLYGAWYAAEPSGTWSSGTQDYLVFDAPTDMRSTGISVTVTGTHLGAPGEPRTLSILANGRNVRTVRSTDANALSFTVRMTPAELAKSAGRIAIEFDTPAGLTSTVPGTDQRTLVFQVGSVRLTGS